MIQVGPVVEVVVEDVRENGLLVKEGQSQGWIDLVNLEWGNEPVFPPGRYRVGQRLNVVIYHRTNTGFFASLKHAHPDDPFDASNPRVRRGDVFDGELVYVSPAYCLIRLLPGVLGILPAVRFPSRILTVGERLRVRVCAVDLATMQVQVEV